MEIKIKAHSDQKRKVKTAHQYANNSANHNQKISLISAKKLTIIEKLKTIQIIKIDIIYEDNKVKE